MLLLSMEGLYPGASPWEFVIFSVDTVAPGCSLTTPFYT